MKKWTVVGLFWLVQVFTDIIRISLAVVAPTLDRMGIGSTLWGLATLALPLESAEQPV